MRRGERPAGEDRGARSSRANSTDGHEALQSECAALEERCARPARRSAGAARARGGRSAACHPAPDPGAAEDNALREWLERTAWKRCRACAEAAHRPGLGDRRGIGAARAPACARAFRCEQAAVGTCRPATGESERVRSRSGPGTPVAPGYEPLASKMRAVDPAVSGALADWLAGAMQRKKPDAARRAALPPARCSSTAMATVHAAHRQLSRAG